MLTTNELVGVLIANLIVIAIGLLLFYKSWLSFFRPDWFFIFNIFENGFLNYVEHKLFLPIKGRKESYNITNCEYNKEGCKPYLNGQGVYTWNFKKGMNKPVFFADNDETNISGHLIAESKKMSLDDIWFGNNGIEDFLKTYGILILAIIMIALFGYMITQNQQTTNLILNITQRG